MEIKITAGKRRKKKTKNLSSFVDKMNQKEKEEANISLAKFFFGCNIPFSVVESDHFKNFLKPLRPAYNPPTRKTLSSTLLDKVHEHVLINNKNSLKKSATLLIDGWKNSSNNTNNVVTMLQTLNGESVFLESYDFSTAKETGEALAEVCNNALETAKSAYNCEIYAVVSDNASNMVKMGRLINLWHSTCSSHTGNLLVKDIVDHDVMKTVTLVLKEFKHTTLENMILQRGGLKIVVPVETGWCSHRDSCDSLLKNLRIMKQVAAEEHTKIKAEVTCYLYNEEFIESVKATVALLDPICKIINTCQNKSTSIADSTEEWLKLNNQVKESESYNDKIKRCVKSRTNMALNIYSLAANYLHPNYRGNLLSKEQKQMVQDFLINSLDSEESLDGLNAFIRNEGIFDTLKKKAQNISVSTFWGLVETKYEALSTLAQKLLSIPASSAQLERLFSNWSFVHSDLRNRLTKEKSSKLVSVYYSLKLKDSNVSDQY
ncbi:uncharacterized protein LOC126743119 [Anthonomus grandis grandis]|uniref:uncharacterized protein LOC126743119 n=1 Tax=Anthonomus grandis grandis TaxID=2921223 RepID=UPI002166145C|nr:uncharacterized protein LOC126743119 [Anthonomus grandis grandis]